MGMSTPRVLLIALTIVMLAVAPCMAQGQLAKGEARKIAEEAFVYGFPMVMNYAVFYEYFVDKTSGQYKAPINQLFSGAFIRPRTRRSSHPTATHRTRSSRWTCAPSPS